MKTNKILALILAVAMIMSTMGIVASADIASADVWDGTYDTSWYDENDKKTEYTLTTAAQFAGFAKLQNEYAHTQLHLFQNVLIKLDTDIDLNNLAWEPIGHNSSNGRQQFKGMFDGQGHKVYNLNVPDDYGIAGLFGQLNQYDSSYYIKNLTIVNATVASDTTASKAYAGALVGRANGYTIENCHVTGTVNISGYNYVGGLIGHSYANISECSVNASGTISATNSQCGGLVGAHFATEDSSVSDCSVKGDAEKGGLLISASTATAGVVGYVNNENNVDTTLNSLSIENINIKAADSSSSTGYIATGYTATNSTSSGVVVTDANNEVITPDDADDVKVAIFKANGVAYFTLADAINNIGNDKTITLLDDVTFDKALTINANAEDIIIDINDNTLTFNAPANVLKNGNFTIKNGTINFVEGITTTETVLYVQAYSGLDTSLLIENVVINAPDYEASCGLLGVYSTSTLKMNNVEINDGGYSGVSLIYGNSQQGNFESENVEINVNGSKAVIYGVDIDADNLTVEGNVKKGVLSVVSGTIANSSFNVTFEEDETEAYFLRDAGYEKSIAFENTTNESEYKTVLMTGANSAVYADAASDLGVTDGIETLVAKVGNKGYAGIQDAIDAAEADATVEILYSEEAYPQFKVPANKPLTLRGIPKTAATRSLSGENPVISITNVHNSWGNKTGATYESKVTVENLDFVVEEDAVGSGFMGVFSYLPDGQSVDGSSFTNCNFVNKSDLEDIKAIIAHAENITVTNCTFENFKTAVYCCNDGGTLDEYSITNSTFDKVDYIIDGYWGYGEADSAFTFTGNTVNDARTNGAVPTFIVWDFAYTTNNGSVPSVKNINIANNTYKTKAELVTIDMTSNTTVATDATWVKTYGTVDRAKNSGALAENEVFFLSSGYELKKEAYKLNATGEAIELEGGEITVVFESIKDKNNKDTGAWNIVLQAADNTELFEFVSAELKFINESLVESGFENKKMNYTVEGTDSISVTKNLDENHEATYAFYLNAQDANGNLVARPSGNKVTIGKVIFDGKGTMALKVDDSSRVIGTVYGTHDEAEFVANDSSAKYVLKVGTGLSSDSVKTTKRDVKIAIEFEHDISMAKDDAYRKIEVTLKDSIGNPAITKDVTIKDVNSGSVVFEDVTIGVITVTLKADGFRTYTYQTTMEDTEEDFELLFWNSVKREKELFIEEGNDRSKMKHNFLVGDIAMDYIIDKYDLAAVTSYYGNYDIQTGDKYVRYDLDRDGDIDILDVAYVLHGMGN